MRGPDIRDWIDEWSDEGKLFTIALHSPHRVVVSETVL